MKVVNFVLALLALLGAAAAAGYSWYSVQEQSFSADRMTSDIALDLEKRIGQSTGDIEGRMAALSGAQGRLRQQLQQLQSRQEEDGAAHLAQISLLREQVARLSQSLQQVDDSWILESIAGTLQMVERSIRMRQSAELSTRLLGQLGALIEQLPAAESARLNAAVQQDLEQLPLGIEQDLPSLSRRLDRVEALIKTLPRPCCDTMGPTPEGVQHFDPDAGFWERVLAVISSGVRLRKTHAEPALQLDRYERGLLQLSLSLRLSQVRMALWSYDQEGWQLGWDALLEDAAPGLAHDPRGFEQLRDMVEQVSALSVLPLDFRFEKSWQILSPP